jgi:hypothetical protein
LARVTGNGPLHCVEHIRLFEGLAQKVPLGAAHHGFDPYRDVVVPRDEDGHHVAARSGRAFRLTSSPVMSGMRTSIRGMAG